MMKLHGRLAIVVCFAVAAEACSSASEQSDVSDEGDTVVQISQASTTPRAEIVTGDSANIYKLTRASDLTWHRDLRRDGGLPSSWHANSGNIIRQDIASVRSLVSGAQGQLYVIDDAGNLKWYGHDGQTNGSWTWSASSGNVIGSGWAGFQRITASPDGTIYAVDASGNLRWYQDLCRNGTSCWHASSGVVIGWGWGSLRSIVADESGTIYTIDNGGTLRWYRNLGPSSSWAWAAGTGNTVGVGWNFQHVFSGRSGILYAVDASGNLHWYRDLNRNGTFAWWPNSGATIGTGWLGAAEAPATPCFAQDAWPIGVEWTTSPGITDALGFRLRNKTTSAKTVEVDIIARGLDGRQESRALLTTTVAAQATPTFSFPKSYIPIWSHAGQSAASLSVRVQGSTDPPFQSRDLAYEFDASFGTMTVYGRHGKPFSSITPEAYYGRDPGQSVAALTDDVLQVMSAALSSPVSGRIESNGQFQTWWNPVVAAESGRGATILLDGKWAQIVSTVVDFLETPQVVNPAWQLCLEHRVLFRDEGRKVAGQAEYYRSSSQGTFPARYLWVTIMRQAAGTLQRIPVYNGPLDQTGCIGLPSLAPGNYTAWTFDRVQKGTTVAKAYDVLRRADQPKWCYSLDGGTLKCPDEYPAGGGVAFTVGSNGQLPVGLAISLSDVIENTANVAASYGQALFAPDNGFIAGETYVAFANERCPWTDDFGRRLDACYNGVSMTMSDAYGETRVFPARAVWLGWSYGTLAGDALTPGIANAEYKYVVGHEFGHQIQDRLMGDLPYAYDLRKNISVPQLCTCTGLDPGGNEIHCLQSSEQQGAAQSEAYGHFVAGNMWNARPDTECVFTYYKKFLRADNVVDVPPAAKSCKQAVRWTETYCPIPARASEYDWMGFYTSVARATTGTVAQTDLARVYGRTCTGSPTGKCNGQGSVSWAGLDSAAQSEFGGLGAPRYVTFSQTGNAYGVTR